MLNESIFLEAGCFILLQKANLIFPESDLKTVSGHTYTLVCLLNVFSRKVLLRTFLVKIG
jgi:hypothetical protein